MVHPVEATPGRKGRRDLEKITPGQIILGAGMIFTGALVIYTAIGAFCVSRLFRRRPSDRMDSDPKCHQDRPGWAPFHAIDRKTRFRASLAWALDEYAGTLKKLAGCESRGDKPDSPG